jgi:hypothetical protein
MATLGEVLARARRGAGELEAWVRDADRDLSERLQQAARSLDLTAAGYARMAVADFARLADEEDWASLMSRLRDSPDPGMICLAQMVGWRIEARGCARHAANAQDNGG